MVDVRVACLNPHHISRDHYHNMRSKGAKDIFFHTFCRAYVITDDWPMPSTRVDAYVQHIDQDTPNVFESTLLEMRDHVRHSYGSNGRILTMPNSSHVLRTILRMTGVEHRDKINGIISECIQIYSEKLPLMVVECPETWLFVEYAHGLLEQCADGKCINSGELIHLASLLPSKADWFKLRDGMKFKIGSAEANKHMWCWFRLKYVFSDFVRYSKIWKSGDKSHNNTAFERASSV